MMNTTYNRYDYPANSTDPRYPLEDINSDIADYVALVVTVETLPVIPKSWFKIDSGKPYSNLLRVQSVKGRRLMKKLHNVENLLVKKFGNQFVRR
jgi:hypothetical protein